MDRGARHVTIEVRGAIGPPHRSTFAEGNLGDFNMLARLCFSLDIAASTAVADRPASRHQFSHQALALGLVKRWVAAPPQAASNSEISPIRRDRVSHRLTGAFSAVWMVLHSPARGPAARVNA